MACDGPPTKFRSAAYSHMGPLCLMGPRGWNISHSFDSIWDRTSFILGAVL